MSFKKPADHFMLEWLIRLTTFTDHQTFESGMRIIGELLPLLDWRVQFGLYRWSSLLDELRYFTLSYVLPLREEFSKSWAVSQTKQYATRP
jgi:hypothetical protein